MKRAGLALAALILSACASVGTNFDMATVNSLRPGMTEEQIVGVLGQPNSRTMLADGSEQWMWVYAHAEAFGAAHSQAVMLKFGPDRRYIGGLNSTQTQMR